MDQNSLKLVEEFKECNSANFYIGTNFDLVGCANACVMTGACDAFIFDKNDGECI